MLDSKTFSVTKELAEAEVGDKRLNARLVKLVTGILRRPADSFPEISGSIGALEATYRFLGNMRVSPEKILAPHIEATITRACREKRIIVAHDRTEFIFGGKSRKEELGWTHQNNQGFYGHFCLALSRGAFVRPLGVLGFEAIFRKCEPGSKKPTSDERRLNPNRESQSWWRAVHRTENLFPVAVKPVHVADREADDYELFSDLVQDGMRFVIRLNHNRRNCSIAGKKEKAKLFDLLDGLNVLCEREVPISKRNASKFPATTARFPPRAARIARLHATAATVELPRTQGANSLSKTIRVNCVHVFEIDVPNGVKPVDWKLLTSEPIDSAENILNIIDDYRARWTIEEYFKALKTGCAYEKRQLESKHSLLNALAIFAPIACQLLLLKTLNYHQPSAPAETVLTPTQIEVLRVFSTRELSEALTVKEALLAIAALGGHIPNNGDPGWLIIGRGLEDLLKMEAVWIEAMKRCDQS